MHQRTRGLLAALIPREAWDPAHHSPKWVDSYAEPIAIRREWPARQWLVGLNPKSPKEFLCHSMRNLAYEYNASLRACNTFPEMIPFYKEMMVRGVKMDVDTMYIVLSRAARCPAVSVEEIFLLWDEMLSHGARPDLATTEVLQTVLSVAGDDTTKAEIVEHRGKQLIGTYSALCCAEMRRMGEKKHFGLLQQVFQRCRENAMGLKSMLAFECYSTYISYLVRDVERPDTLSFRRDSVDRTDTAFLESIAAVHTVEGVLLALRYDVEKSHQSSGHAVEITTSKSHDGDKPKAIYLYSLKKLFSPSGSGVWQSLQHGVGGVYLSALQSAVYRYGTSDGVDSKRLLYFCRLLWMDISLNELTVNSAELLETLMEIYRFYGKAQAARTALEYCWTHRLMTAKILGHYVSCVDPWDQDKGFALFQLTGGRAMFHRRNRLTTQSKLEKGTSGTSEKSLVEVNVHSADELESRFHEIRKFALESLSSGSVRYSPSEVFHIPTALLWFLRRAIDSASSRSVKDKSIFQAACRCLENVHRLQSNLLRNRGVITEALAQSTHFSQAEISVETEQLTEPAQKVYSCALPSDVVGDYTDAFFYLLEIIALNVEKDDVANVLQLRAAFLGETQKDDRLLMSWLEEN